MNVTAYTKGLTADVRDNPAVVPASSSTAVGSVIVYAKGLTAQIVDMSAASLVVHKVPLNMSSMVLLDLQHYSSAYERFQRHECITSTFSYRFHWENLLASGTRGPFHYPKYGLEFGDGLTRGVELATYTRTGGETFGTFAGNVVALADGPYYTQIVAYDANGARVVAPTETLMGFWLWVDRNGTAKDHPDVIFQNGVFDWTHAQDGGQYLWMRAPKSKVKTRQIDSTWFNIPSVELPVNAAFPKKFPGGEPFNTALPSGQIMRINWLPNTDNGQLIEHRPSVTKRGITVTDNIQGYFQIDATGVVPAHPLLDGPRGSGTVYSPTSFWIGHSGVVYGSDAFAFWRVNQKGKKTTLSGLRHPRALYWEDMGSTAGRTPMQNQATIPGVEIVGDWDASIPAVRRFPWESWGLVFDMRTTGLDPSLPTVNLPPFGQLPQHLGEGPVAFQTCRFGRILKNQFHKDRPADPPTITEHVTGLSDPWGLDMVGNVIYVTERGAHRISMWDADTGARLGVLIENLNGATFGSVPAPPGLRKFTFKPQYLSGAEPNYTLLRTANIIAPEGMAIQDGWLYWGSMAQGEVRRINLMTKAVEICCRVPIFYQVQSLWIEVKLSDGTFGPRGTIFTTTFDNQTFGRPRAFLPGVGTDTDGTVLTNKNQWPWHAVDNSTRVRGPGPTAPLVYATGIHVANGMLVCGSSGPGFAVHTKATLGEITPDQTRLKRGYDYYNAQGYRLKFGNYCMGYIDEPLPWGENVDMDYWMQHGCGMTL